MGHTTASTDPALTRPVAYVGGQLHTTEGPADALLVADGRIAAIGSIDEVLRGVGDHQLIRLEGAAVLPSFVDAHVHTIAVGQALTELDLSTARSRIEVLDLVADHADLSTAPVIVGFNWSESEWVDDQRPPSADELDRAAGGRQVYLPRVDVHSGLVSGALAAAVPGLRSATGWQDSGWITRDAHHLVRDHVSALLGDQGRDGLVEAALDLAARRGITEVHENCGPHLGTWADVDRIHRIAEARGMTVRSYWGEPADDTLINKAREHGVAGLAGDLCADGAFGSRTAALSQPYTDDPASSGFTYLSVDQLTEHLVACARAGLQSGFHCIGDRAIGEIATACRRAAQTVGPAAFRASRPRLEHVELCHPADLATLVDLGVTLSVQPDFDAQWAGAGGMYERRLGRSRADATNPIGSMVRAGAQVAFGSDAPVTALSAWRAVSGAMRHHQPSERLSFDQALHCATVGGRRSGGGPGGTLAVGERADFSVWPVELTEAIGRAEALTTDELDAESVLTVAGGRAVHDVLGQDALRSS
ncbi:amidohydrolase [Propionibacteriaceae bacterium Y1685]